MERKDSLVDILRILYKWRKRIILVCVIAAVGSIIISLTMPNYYMAETVFLAASPDLSQPDELFKDSKKRIYGDDLDVDRMLTIAKSSKLLTYLVDTFNLYDRYNIDPDESRAQFKVQKKLINLYSVERNKYNAIVISVEDKDPEVAAQIAKAARERIDYAAQEIIRESQERMIETYEKSIEKKKNMMEEIRDSLKYFRNQYGIYNAETQGELLGGLVAKIGSELEGTKAKLKVLKGQPGVTRDSLVNTEAKLASLENQAKVLNEQLTAFNKGATQMMSYFQRLQTVNFQVSSDMERYNQFKSSYESDFSAIHLIEEAKVPDNKSRPKRSIIVVVSVLLAFIFSMLATLLLETYKDLNLKEVTDA